MPTQKDQIIGRLAVDLGYLTHEQIGKAFIEHQMQVSQQGVKASLAEMLVVQGLLTGDRARELEEAAAVEYGVGRPEAAPSSTSGGPQGPKKRRPRRPSTRSFSPVARARQGNQMWIAAAGGAGILLLAVVSYLMLAGGPPEDPLPIEPETTEGPVAEEVTAEAPPANTRVTLTPVTETLITETPITETPDAAGDDEGDTDAAGIDPEIAELLAAAEAAAERMNAAPPKAPAAPAAPAAKAAPGIRQGLVGHWTFDEGRGTVAMDMSGRGANGTVKGGRWTRGRIGGALEFDGTDDYVDCGRGLDLAGKSVTVAMWAKRTAHGANHNMLTHGTRSSAGRMLHVVFTENDRFRFSFVTNNLDAPGAHTDSEWHHWACTYDARTNARSIYRDGVVVASDTARVGFQGSGVVYIGKGLGNADCFPGPLDDVRIYARALGAGEVKTLADPARLAAAERGTPDEAGEPAAPPPPAAGGIRHGLVGHWTFDEGRGTVAMDMSGRGANGTARAVKWVRGRIGRGALYFNGVNGSVQVTGYKGVTGKSPRTVAVWIKTNSTKDDPIISWGADKPRSKYALRLDLNTHALRIEVVKGNVVGSTPLNDGLWHHVAVVLPDGAANVTHHKLYVDGKLDAVGSESNRGIDTASGADVRIGTDFVERHFRGLMDDVRIYERGLSAAEIGTLADPARLAAAERGTPDEAGQPAAPPPAAAPSTVNVKRGLVGHWTFDEGRGAVAMDMSGRGANGAVKGGTWTRGRIGGALALGGKGHHVALDNVPHSFSGTFSVAAWVRFDSFAKHPAIMSKEQDGEDFAFVLYANSIGQLRLNTKRARSESKSAAHPTTLATGKWHHVAAVMDAASNVTLFVDGARSIPTAMANRNDLGSLRLGTTHDPWWAGFDGGMDDVRIYARALTSAEMRTLADPARLAAAESGAPAEAPPAAERTDAAPAEAPVAPVATGIRQGLVGHWTFDEGRGSVAMDMSGRGANGKVNGAKWVAGRIGGALEFDGMFDCVTVANESVFDARDRISVSVWVKVTGGWRRGWQTFVSRGGEAGKGWQLRRLSSTDGICFTLRGTSAVDDEGGGATTVGSDGLWHHIVGVYDGKRRKVYIDGALYHDIRDTGRIAATGSPVVMGAKPNNGRFGSHHRGAVDDVRIYGRALSAAEVVALARRGGAGTAGRGPPAAGLRPEAPAARPPAGGDVRQGLLGHWTFDEGRGTVAMDMSGRGANGKVAGAKWVAGRIGGALEFDEAERRHVRTPPMALARRSFTLSAWARRARTGELEMLIAHGRNEDGAGLHFGFRDTGQFTLAFWNDDLRTEALRADLDWHHWAATYDFDSGARVVYRDGVAVASDVAKGAYTGSGCVDIGTMSFGPRRSFCGLMDDVRIYGRALSPPEVRTLAGPARGAAAGGAKAPPAPAAEPSALGTRQGLLGHWTCDEGRGTILMDMSGHGVNGTVTGAKWVRGRIGGALEFDGKSYVHLSKDRAFDLTDNFSISVWIYRTGSAGYNHCGIIDKLARWESGYAITWDPRQKSRGTRFVFFSSESGWSGDKALDFNAGAMNRWYHLAAVVNNGRASVYTNGVLQNTLDRTGETVKRNDWRLKLGRRGAITDQWQPKDKRPGYFIGSIDDVRVYGRPLAPSEIRTLADPARLTAAEKSSRR